MVSVIRLYAYYCSFVVFSINKVHGKFKDTQATDKSIFNLQVIGSIESAHQGGCEEAVIYTELQLQGVCEEAELQTDSQRYEAAQTTQTHS